MYTIKYDVTAVRRLSNFLEAEHGFRNMIIAFEEGLKRLRKYISKEEYGQLSSLMREQIATIKNGWPNLYELVQKELFEILVKQLRAAKEGITINDEASLTEFVKRIPHAKDIPNFFPKLFQAIESKNYREIEKELNEALNSPFNFIAYPQVKLTADNFESVVNFVNEAISGDFYKNAFVPLAKFAKMQELHAVGLFRTVSRKLGSQRTKREDSEFFARSMKKREDGSAAAQVSAKQYFDALTNISFQHIARYSMQLKEVADDIKKSKIVSKKDGEHDQPNESQFDSIPKTYIAAYQQLISVKNKFEELAAEANKSVGELSGKRVSSSSTSSEPVEASQNVRAAEASQNVRAANLTAGFLRSIAFASKSDLGKKIGQAVSMPKANGSLDTSHIKEFETDVLKIYFDKNNHGARTDIQRSIARRVHPDMIIDRQLRDLLHILLSFYDKAYKDKVSRHGKDYQAMCALVGGQPNAKVQSGDIYFIAQFIIQRVVMMIDKFLIKEAKKSPLFRVSAAESNIIGLVLDAIGALFDYDEDELNSKIQENLTHLPESEQNIVGLISHTIRTIQKGCSREELRTLRRNDLLNEIGSYFDTVLSKMPGTTIAYFMQPFGEVERKSQSATSGVREAMEGKSDGKGNPVSAKEKEKSSQPEAAAPAKATGAPKAEVPAEGRLNLKRMEDLSSPAITQFIIQQSVTMINNFLMRDARTSPLSEVAIEENRVLKLVLNAVGELLKRSHDELNAKIKNELTYLPESRQNIVGLISHTIRTTIQKESSDEVLKRLARNNHLLNEIGSYFDAISGEKPGTTKDYFKELFDKRKGELRLPESSAESNEEDSLKGKERRPLGAEVAGSSDSDSDSERSVRSPSPRDERGSSGHLKAEQEVLARFVKLVKEFYLNSESPRVWDRYASRLANLAQYISQNAIYQAGELFSQVLPGIIEQIRASEIPYGSELIKKLEEFLGDSKCLSIAPVIRINKEAHNIFVKFIDNFYKHRDKDAFYQGLKIRAGIIAGVDAKDKLINWLPNCIAVAERSNELAYKKELVEGLRAVEQSVKDCTKESISEQRDKVIEESSTKLDDQTRELLLNILRIYDYYSNNLPGFKNGSSQKWHAYISHIVNYAIDVCHLETPLFAKQCILKKIDDAVAEIHDHGFSGSRSRLANELALLSRHYGGQAKVKDEKHRFPQHVVRYGLPAASVDSDINSHRLMSKNNEKIIAELLRVVGFYEDNNIGCMLLKNGDTYERNTKHKKWLQQASHLRKFALEAYQNKTAITDIVREIDRTVATMKDGRLSATLRKLSSYYGGASVYIEEKHKDKVMERLLVLDKKYGAEDPNKVDGYDDPKGFIEKHFVKGLITRDTAKGKIVDTSEVLDNNKISDDLLKLIARLIRVVAYYTDMDLGQAIINKINSAGGNIAPNDKKKWLDQAYRLGIEALRIFETNPANAQDYLVSKMDDIVKEIRSHIGGDDSRLAQTLAIIGQPAPFNGKSVRFMDDDNVTIPGLPEELYQYPVDTTLNDDIRNDLIDTIYKFAVQIAESEVDKYRDICHSRFFTKTADIKDKKSGLIKNDFRTVYSNLHADDDAVRQQAREEIYSAGSVSKLLSGIITKHTTSANTNLGIYRGGQFGKMVNRVNTFITDIQPEPGTVFRRNLSR